MNFIKKISIIILKNNTDEKFNYFCDFMHNRINDWCLKRKQRTE